MVRRLVVEGQSGLPVPNSTLSYWHTDPSKKLLGYRSTPDLPKEVDTVIIGTGMTGSFAARFLKESSPPGSSLLVLEAREACWGATGRNGGHCQPFLYGTSEAVARFELETYSFLQDLVEREGVPADWRPVNGVHALLSQDAFDAAARSIPALRRRVPDFADKVAVVSPEGLLDGPEDEEWARGLTLESLRLNRPEVKGAIVQKHAASMWPYKLVAHVLEGLLAAHGPGELNLQTGTPVTGLSRDAESGRWAVATRRGRVSAAKVLLATNAYTSRLLPAFADLIVPVRGQVAALLPPEPRVGLDYSYVFFGKIKDENGDDTTRDEYLVQRPLPGGELILGGGRHAARGLAVGEWRDDVVEPGVAAWLRTELEPVLGLGREEGRGAPGEGLRASLEWTGIMAYSRDHVPWIGAVPEALGGGEGLFIASGFNGHGMPRCALAGRGIARIISGDVEGHGLPEEFLASEERAVRARRDWGRVGTVDELEALIANLNSPEGEKAGF